MANETPVRFHVTQTRVEEMELGLMLDASGDNVSLPAAARFLAFFAVDESGAYLEGDAAMAVVRRLKMTQLNETVERLVAEMQETAVPNE